MAWKELTILDTYRQGDYYRREIKIDRTTEQNGIITVLIDAYKGKMDKVVSKLYQAMLKSKENSSLYIKQQ